MFKDLCRTVHLAQDDNHLVVDEFLELSQVAGHVHFQLRSDLCIAGKQGGYEMEETKTTGVPGCVLLYLFAGDILQVFLHHDLPQTGFDLSLRQLPFCRPAEAPPKTNLPSLFQLSSCCITELYWDTYTSEKSTGESARCDCTSRMAFHSLMRTWSEETLLW